MSDFQELNPELRHYALPDYDYGQPGLFSTGPSTAALSRRVEGLLDLAASADRDLKFARDSNQKLLGQLTISEQLGKAARDCANKIEHIIGSGEIDELALVAASAQVIAEERERRKQLLVPKIIAEERARFIREAFPADKAVERKDNLRAAMEEDGTLDEVRQQIRAEQDQADYEAIVAEEKARLDTPEAKKAYINARQAEIGPDSLIVRAGKQAQDELRKAWDKIALETAKEEIKSIVARDADEQIAARREAWMDGPEGQEYRAKIKKEIEADISNLSIKELEEAIALIERHKQLVELLEKKQTAEKVDDIKRNFIDHFNNSGVDLSKIPVNYQVVIQLGEVQKVDNPSYDRYSPYDNQPAKIASIQIQREFTLLSRGGGSFLVQGDSLEKSNDRNLKSLALSNTIITVGRQVKDGTAKETVLEMQLSKGDKMFYDTDTTNKEDFQSTEYETVNIIIEGVDAREDIKQRNYVKR